jgi:phage baseplate assembly protein W
MVFWMIIIGPSMVLFRFVPPINGRGILRKEYLGRGFGFPFRFNASTGSVALSEYESNIRDSITLILGTRPGERQMLPEFGCHIQGELFSANTQDSAQRIGALVKRSLLRWEPRIDVAGVDATVQKSGEIRVTVRYSIRSTLTEQEISLFLAAGG